MPRRSRRHDHDAGGDPSLLAAKAARREQVWSAMSVAGVARFPGAAGRIPNFVGAEDAARQLDSTDAWRRTATLKANPDSPQLPVRHQALREAKAVVMAVPRLAAEEPFLLLDPAELPVGPRQAASIKGASRYGRAVGPDEVEPVDLVVVGSVAVTPDGARLGKGGGFSDLEFAIAAAAGLITASTVVATTVHEVQVLSSGDIPLAGHDLTLDLIATPERVIECPRDPRASRTPPLRWEELTEAKIASIPLLGRLRAGGHGS